MIKGLLVFLAVLCLLMGLLIFAKSRPGPSAALHDVFQIVTRV